MTNAAGTGPTSSEAKGQKDNTAAPPAPHGTLADRLQALLDWYQKRYGIRPGASDIARAVNRSGGKVSHTTVAALINGNNDNPVLKTLVDIADFFGVDPSYFVTRDADRVDESDTSAEERLRRLARTNPHAADQVELLFAMKEAGVTRIGARGFLPTGPGRDALLRIVRGVGQLTPDGQLAVAGVVDAMKKMGKGEDE